MNPDCEEELNLLSVKFENNRLRRKDDQRRNADALRD